MCLMDKRGFPRTKPKQAKRVKGFQTGDLVRAVVTTGTKQGTYVGKVAVRSSGSFNVTTKHGTIQGINHRFCVLVARSDGYSYQQGKERAFPSPLEGGRVSIAWKTMPRCCATSLRTRKQSRPMSRSRKKCRDVPCAAWVSALDGKDDERDYE